MRSYAPSQRRRTSSDYGKEPNLIPIMNLFLVLIPMLMTMMVSVHLAMLGINYSAGGAGADAEGGETEEIESISLKIMMNSFDIIVGENEPIEIATLENTGETVIYDFPKLDETLIELKENAPEQNTIVIMTEPDVLFDTLLRTIDLCKYNGFPSVKYISVQKQLLRRAS
jgi:biopolymer transport protein ExbD